MHEYIEREAAIKELMNDDPEQVGYSREDAADCIRYMDAADVVPVRHSRWVHCFRQDGETVGQCYECHAIRFVDPYCPNCGAKMDGGETDA